MVAGWENYNSLVSDMLNAPYLRSTFSGVPSASSDHTVEANRQTSIMYLIAPAPTQPRVSEH